MPRTPGKALADTRHAIIKKIKRMQSAAQFNTYQSAMVALGDLRRFIEQMDERALTRKGGLVRPRRPLKKIKKG